jgi:hypothetical protein
MNSRALARRFKASLTGGILLVAAAAAFVPTAATASESNDNNGCIVKYTSSGGNDYCLPALENGHYWASANCYFWPGDVGVKEYIKVGHTDGPFSHIACSTHITQAYSNWSP